MKDFDMERILIFSENYGGGGQDYTTYQYIKALGLNPANSAIMSNKESLDAISNYLGSKIASLDHRFFSYGAIYHWAKKNHPWARRLFTAPVFAARPLLMLINIARYIATIKRYNVSGVLVFNGGYPASECCCAMAIAAGLSTDLSIMSIVNTPEERKGLWGAYEKGIDSLLWKTVDKIIVNGNSLKKDLQEKRSMPEELAETIHNCSPRLRILKAGSRIDNTKIIRVGVMARLEPVKNIANLIVAFSNQPEFPIAELHIAGEGGERKHLEDLSLRLGINEKVIFHGHLDDNLTKAAFLSSIDIYAFPSWQEGFPYSILEAMMARCAIVSSNAGSIEDALIHERNSLIFDVGDHAMLEVHLKRLINVPELRVRLSRAAEQDYEQNFSEERMFLNINNSIRPSMAHLIRHD